MLRLLFDDYVLYLVEYVHVDVQMRQFLKQVTTDEPPQITDSLFSGNNFAFKNILDFIPFSRFRF